MSIAGKHSDILADLYETFSAYMAGSVKKISAYRCLEILVEDYRHKRPSSNQHPKSQSPSVKKSPPPYEKLFESIESDVLSLKQKQM